MGEEFLLTELLEEGSLEELGDYLRDWFSKQRGYSPKYQIYNELLYYQEKLDEKLALDSVSSLRRFLLVLRVDLGNLAHLIVNDHKNTLIRVFKRKFGVESLSGNLRCLAELKGISEDVAEEIVKSCGEEIIQALLTELHSSKQSYYFGNSFFNIIKELAKVSKSSANVFVQNHKDEIIKLAKKEILGRKIVVDFDFLPKIALISGDMEAEFARATKKSLEKKIKTSPLKEIALFLSPFDTYTEKLGEITFQIHKKTLVESFNRKFQETSFQEIINFLNSLYKVSEGLVTEIVQTSKNRLITSKKVNFLEVSAWDIYKFLSILRNTSEENYAAIIENNRESFSKCTKRFLRNKEERNFLDFLKGLMSAPTSISLEIMSENKTVLDEYFRVEPILKLFELLSTVARVSEHKAVEMLKIFKPIIFEKLDKRVQNLPFIEMIKIFLNSTEISANFAEEIAQRYSEPLAQLFKENIQVSSLQNLGHFLSVLANASKDIANDILQANKDLLNDLLNNRIGDSYIGWIGMFFQGLADISETVASEFAQLHRDKLANLLKHNYQVFYGVELGEFFLGMSKASMPIAIEMIHIVKNETDNLFLDKIRQFHPEVFIIFLEGIASTSKELANEIVQENKQYILKKIRNLPPKKLDSFHSKLNKAPDSLIAIISQIYEIPN